MNRWQSLIILLMILAGTVLRFVGLESSPPGFHRDEAAIAAQVISVRETGRDYSGTRFPLFSPVLSDGFVTPTYLYSGVAWSAVFGDSIAAHRSLAAFYGALTVMGVYLLARSLWSAGAGALAALACAVSPWGFQFSRIAWDLPLAPCFLVWSLYLLMSAGPGRRAWVIGPLAGLCAAFACYSYPPVRLHVALLLPPAIYFAWRYRRVGVGLWGYLIAFGVAIFPLVRLTITGKIQARFHYLSIFNPSLHEPWGGSSAGLVIRLFGDNLAGNFSLRGLLLDGGPDGLATIGAVGLWGSVEIIALLIAGAWLIRFLFYRPLWKTPGEQPKWSPRVLADRRAACWTVGLMIWGYVAGVIPAALTNTGGQMSAMRSVGAYPFVCLFAGFVLDRAARFRWLVPAMVGLVMLHSAWHFYGRFVTYPRWSGPWFQQRAADAGLAANTPIEAEAAIRQIDPAYPELSIAYFRYVKSRPVAGGGP